MPKMIYDVMPPKRIKKKEFAVADAMVKIVAVLLMVCLNWAGLSAVYDTIAYFHDTEDNNNNFAAGSLDFDLIVSEDFGFISETSFVYDAKPNPVYVDNCTYNFANQLCAGDCSQISLDTSNGQTHYIYMNWDLGEDISQYQNTDYFDLKLQHKENTTEIKVELKDGVGDWIEVCDPPEAGSFVWTSCDLTPFISILKDVSPNIEMRIVAKKTGNCHEYLKCARLQAKLHSPSEPVTRTIKVVNYGNIPKYTVAATGFSGGLCDYLNTQASLDGVDIGYNGPLINFSSGLVIFTEPEDEWVFSLSLSPSAPSSIWGESCSFDFVFYGSQIKNDLPLGQGFNDTEQVSNTVNSQSFSGVLINEFLPNPVCCDSALMPNGEWVELYNDSGAEVDVVGWWLYDECDCHELAITNDNTNTGSTLIPDGGFLVVYRNGDSDFALDNVGGDSVRLYDGPIGTGNLIDSYTYTVNAPEGKSFARVPDGSPNWVDPIPTPGEPNTLEGEEVVFGPAIAEPGEGEEDAEIPREPCEEAGSNRPCSSQIGACQIGVQICQNGFWGECLGAIFPQPEICDGVDNDCDGETDEGVCTVDGFFESDLETLLRDEPQSEEPQLEESIEEESAEEETETEETTEEPAEDEPIVEEEPAEPTDETVQEEPTEELNEESAVEEGIEEEPSNEEPITEEEPDEEEPIEEEPTEEELTEEVVEEPVEDEPKEELIEEEVIVDEEESVEEPVAEEEVIEEAIEDPEEIPASEEEVIIEEQPATEEQPVDQPVEEPESEPEPEEPEPEGPEPEQETDDSEDTEETITE